MLEILSEGIGFGFLILFPGPSFITKIYNIIEVTIRINMIIDIIINSSKINIDYNYNNLKYSYV